MQRVFLAMAGVAVIGIGACSRRPVQAARADSVSPEPDMAAHRAILDRERRGPVRVLFLGDSVTHGWADVPSIFDEAFGKDAPCNAGVMLDRVQNVRWRIANGELDGIDPDVILLQVGLSNLVLDHEAPAEVARGITDLVADIHSRRPRAKVVVLDIFPTSGDNAEAVRETNDLLAQRITLRNTGFYRVGDSIPPSDFSDGLHLSSNGYSKLAKELATIITTMYYSGSGWPPHP